MQQMWVGSVEDWKGKVICIAEVLCLMLGDANED